MQEFKITIHEDGQRLDRFLRKTFPQIPLSMIYKFLRKKDIKLNGKKAKKEDLLKDGDMITIFFYPEKFGEKPIKKEPNWKELKASDFYKDNFNIAYEDDFLMVLNKPAGIAVHAGSGTGFSKNLIDLATAYSLGADPRPQLVHRLDKETSGAVIVAKNGSTLRKMTEILRNGEIQKYYKTLARGHLKKKKDTIRSAMINKEGKKQLAITHYKVEKEFKDSSLVSIQLETGRTHQIRKHFAMLKHPVAGDKKYGDFGWNRKISLKRQFLHAERLIFIHPETKKEINIICPISKDLKLFLGSYNSN